ncbi:MAG: type II toxin-antitoxin system RelE/ParE family toxin [Candidatus Wallbacteria bacterium]|nr:type II toxin-antitoxin system RelE/ParE family toxin [Candidatus Wallbacteria bacterium]
MPEIRLTGSAKKDLDRINEPLLSKIVSQIELLAENTKLPNVIKLKARHNEFRMRIGDYRVLFFIDKSTVIISRIVLRREAYR